jgi:hypothetical protein
VLERVGTAVALALGPAWKLNSTRLPRHACNLSPIICLCFVNAFVDSTLRQLINVLCLFFGFPTLEFKEIRKEWKARKKEEENQRKAAEERERAAAQAQVQAQAQAQAGQVDGGAPADPSQGGQPPSYPGGVRPQLPPIGYQPADGQVPGQYGAAGAGGGMVYPQGNGQMAYPPNYPHSPYGQNNQVYQQQRK